MAFEASDKYTTVSKIQLIFTHVSYDLQTSIQCTHSAAFYSKIYHPVLH